MSKAATQFKPGRSGNPTGGSKAEAQARRLGAEFIREQTDGGKDIIRFAVGVMRGERAEINGTPREVPDDPKSRCWAASFLADRLWGKSTVLVEMVEDQPKPVDLSSLKPEALAALAELDAQKEDDDAPSDPVH